MINEKQKWYENAIFCYACKETFEDKHAKAKEYCKVRDQRYYTGKQRCAAHSICNLAYSVPKDIFIVFTMDLTMVITLS